MEVSIKFTGHTTRMHGGHYREDGSKKSSRKPHLFINVDQTSPGTTSALSAT